MSASASTHAAFLGNSRRWPVVLVLNVMMLSLLVPQSTLAADPNQNRGFLSESESVTPRTQGAIAPGAPISGFQESTVFSGLTNPTVVQFANDGRVFVGEKSGIIKVFDNLTDTTPTIFADLRSEVFNNWDRGLLGLALAPNFPTDPHLYVLYTYDHILGDPAPAPKWGATPPTDSDTCPSPPGINTLGCVVSARLSRLTANGNVSDGTEQVLIEDWCQQFPSHSIGTIAFGADGALYVGGGDGASFGPADYGQFGDPYYPGNNPCHDPGGSFPSPPTAEGGALRSQDLRTPAPPPPPPPGSNGYSAAVLAAGPVGYWRLGDTGSVAVDAGPNGLNGSYIGNPTRGVPGALVGDSNTAVKFPTLSDAVTVPDNNLLDLGDGPFSYELWFTLDVNTGGQDQMLLNRGTNAPNIALNGSTRKLMLTKGGFGGLFSGSTVIAANGAWHYLVVTRSAAGAGNSQIYLDGVAETMTPISATTTLASNSEVLTFGRKNVGPVEPWGGKIDEVAIYRRVLSASEVTSHYNAGITP